MWLIFDLLFKIVPEKFWTDRRVIYRELCNLTYDVDDKFAKIILLSFGNNLFFVCIKLASCFKYDFKIIIYHYLIIVIYYSQQPSIEHYLYVWFSLIFLICRTLSVLMYFSQINDQAKIPLRVFRNVPQKGWCPEVSFFNINRE